MGWWSPQQVAPCPYLLQPSHVEFFILTGLMSAVIGAVSVGISMTWEPASPAAVKRPHQRGSGLGLGSWAVPSRGCGQRWVLVCRAQAGAGGVRPKERCRRVLRRARCSRSLAAARTQQCLLLPADPTCLTSHPPKHSPRLLLAAQLAFQNSQLEGAGFRKVNGNLYSVEQSSWHQSVLNPPHGCSSCKLKYIYIYFQYCVQSK